MNTNKKRSISSITKTLIILLLVAIVMSLLNAAIYLIVFAAQGKLGVEELKPLLTSTLIIFPIPTIVLFVVGSIISIVSLKKRQVAINNLLTPLVMSGVDTICIDKASGLISGKLVTKKTIPLKAVGDDYIAQAISNVLCATNNNSAIALALKKEFDLELSSGVIDILSPNENGIFGASFKGGKTFIIGDLNNLPLINQQGIIKRCEEYFKNGHYVIALGESKDLISNGKFEGTLEAIVLVVIKSGVRDGANETFKWFLDDGIDVKVITNDDPISSSLLATEAGINGSDKYISLKGVNFEKIRQIADDYCVFGDLNEDQKRFLVKVLQEKGRTVAVVAAGENNAPVLKQSNCSLSFTDNEEETSKKSNVKLNNSNFSLVKEIINEGKRFNSNLQQIISLILSNAFFVFVVSLVLLFASIGGSDSGLVFPYSINNLLLVEAVLCICAPLALLFLRNNGEKNENFNAHNILMKAIPSSLVLIASVVSIFIIYSLQKGAVVSWGVYSIDTLVTMSVICTSILSIVVSFGIYSPLTKYRNIVLISSSAVVVVLLLVCGLIAYLTNGIDPILNLPFIEMSGPAYLITAIITVVLTAIYLFVNRLISIRKGDYLENEN